MEKLVMAEEEVKLIRPSMIVAPDTAENVAKRISAIDSRIHRSPEAFVMSLMVIGEAAVSHTVDYRDRGDSVINLKKKPADLIIEFFRNRYDLDSEFDAATEESIKNDPTHQGLMSNMKSQTGVRIQTGVMKSENRPSEEAVPARDLVRVQRLSLYLGRVADYQEQQRQAQETGDGLRQAKAN